MNKLVSAVIVFAALGFCAQAQAQCYRFDKAPNDVYVCVGKGGKDSFDDRKRAKQICNEKTGSDCGTVSSASYSCHSNIEKCYDEAGKAHRSLQNY